MFWKKFSEFSPSPTSAIYASPQMSRQIYSISFLGSSRQRRKSMEQNDPEQILNQLIHFNIFPIYLSQFILHWTVLAGELYNIWHFVTVPKWLPMFVLCLPCELWVSKSLTDFRQISRNLRKWHLIYKIWKSESLTAKTLIRYPFFNEKLNLLPVHD